MDANQLPAAQDTPIPRDNEGEVQTKPAFKLTYQLLEELYAPAYQIDFSEPIAMIDPISKLSQFTTHAMLHTPLLQLYDLFLHSTNPLYSPPIPQYTFSRATIAKIAGTDDLGAKFPVPISFPSHLSFNPTLPSPEDPNTFTDVYAPQLLNIDEKQYIAQFLNTLGNPDAFAAHLRSTLLLHSACQSFRTFISNNFSFTQHDVKRVTHLICAILTRILLHFHIICEHYDVVGCGSLNFGRLLDFFHPRQVYLFYFSDSITDLKSLNDDEIDFISTILPAAFSKSPMNPSDGRAGIRFPTTFQSAEEAQSFTQHYTQLLSPTYKNGSKVPTKDIPYPIFVYLAFINTMMMDLWWALTNITAGEREETFSTWTHGLSALIPIYLGSVPSLPSNIFDQILWAISNLIGDGIEGIASLLSQVNILQVLNFKLNEVIRFPVLIEDPQASLKVSEATSTLGLIVFVVSNIVRCDQVDGPLFEKCSVFGLRVVRILFMLLWSQHFSAEVEKQDKPQIALNAQFLLEEIDQNQPTDDHKLQTEKVDDQSQNTSNESKEGTSQDDSAPTAHDSVNQSASDVAETSVQSVTEQDNTEAQHIPTPQSKLIKRYKEVYLPNLTNTRPFQSATSTSKYVNTFTSALLSNSVDDESTHPRPKYTQSSLATRKTVQSYLSDCFWFISYISKREECLLNPKVQDNLAALFSPDLFQMMVSMMIMENADPIPIARALGNFVVVDETLTNATLLSSFYLLAEYISTIPPSPSLFKTQRTELPLLKEISWTASNLSAGTNAQILHHVAATTFLPFLNQTLASQFYYRSIGQNSFNILTQARLHMLQKTIQDPSSPDFVSAVEHAVKDNGRTLYRHQPQDTPLLYPEQLPYLPKYIQGNEIPQSNLSDYHKLVAPLKQRLNPAADKVLQEQYYAMANIFELLAPTLLNKKLWFINSAKEIYDALERSSPPSSPSPTDPIENTQPTAERVQPVPQHPPNTSPLSVDQSFAQTPPLDKKVLTPSVSEPPQTPLIDLLSFPNTVLGIDPLIQLIPHMAIHHNFNRSLFHFISTFNWPGSHKQLYPSAYFSWILLYFEMLHTFICKQIKVMKIETSKDSLTKLITSMNTQPDDAGSESLKPLELQSSVNKSFACLVSGKPSVSTSEDSDKLIYCSAPSSTHVDQTDSVGLYNFAKSSHYPSTLHKHAHLPPSIVKQLYYIYTEALISAVMGFSNASFETPLLNDHTSKNSLTVQKKKLSDLAHSHVGISSLYDDNAGGSAFARLISNVGTIFEASAPFLPNTNHTTRAETVDDSYQQHISELYYNPDSLLLTFQPDHEQFQSQFLSPRILPSAPLDSSHVSDHEDDVAGEERLTREKPTATSKPNPKPNPKAKPKVVKSTSKQSAKMKVSPPKRIPKIRQHPSIPDHLFEQHLTGRVAIAREWSSASVQHFIELFIDLLLNDNAWEIVSQIDFSNDKQPLAKEYVIDYIPVDPKERFDKSKWTSNQPGFQESDHFPLYQDYLPNKYQAQIPTLAQVALDPTREHYLPHSVYNPNNITKEESEMMVEYYNANPSRTPCIIFNSQTPQHHLQNMGYKCPTRGHLPFFYNLTTEEQEALFEEFSFSKAIATQIPLPFLPISSAAKDTVTTPHTAAATTHDIDLGKYLDFVNNDLPTKFDELMTLSDGSPVPAGHSSPLTNQASFMVSQYYPRGEEFGLDTKHERFDKIVSTMQRNPSIDIDEVRPIFSVYTDFCKEPLISKSALLETFYSPSIQEDYITPNTAHLLPPTRYKLLPSTFTVPTSLLLDQIKYRQGLEQFNVEVEFDTFALTQFTPRQAIPHTGLTNAFRFSTKIHPLSHNLFHHSMHAFGSAQIQSQLDSLCSSQFQLISESVDEITQLQDAIAVSLGDQLPDGLPIDHPTTKSQQDQPKPEPQEPQEPQELQEGEPKVEFQDQSHADQPEEQLETQPESKLPKPSSLVCPETIPELLSQVRNFLIFSDLTQQYQLLSKVPIDDQIHHLPHPNEHADRLWAENALWEQQQQEWADFDEDEDEDENDDLH